MFFAACCQVDNDGLSPVELNGCEPAGSRRCLKSSLADRGLAVVAEVTVPTTALKTGPRLSASATIAPTGSGLATVVEHDLMLALAQKAEPFG